MQKELGRFALKKVSLGSPEWRKYHIIGTPTLVAVTKTGPKTHVGFQGQQELVEWLRSIK